MTPWQSATSCENLVHIYSSSDKNSTPMNPAMVAPCGMNCEVCSAHLRNKNVCDGCLSQLGYKSISCLQCIIRNCRLLQETPEHFCYDCPKFPCLRLKQLDKRYRIRYNTSLLQNLMEIKNHGLTKFLEKEAKRWHCPTCGGTICIHKGYCLNCRQN